MTAVVEHGVQEFDAAESHYIPLEEVRADKERWRRFVSGQRHRNMSEFSDVVVSSLEAMIAAPSGERSITSRNDTAHLRELG